FQTLLSLTFIVPFLIVLSTSFVSEEEVMRRGAFILMPQKLDLTAYKMLLSGGSILFNAYKVTIFRVVVGTLLNLTFTSMLAYGLSKKNLPGRNLFITMIFITMLFGGGLIPTYMLIKGLRLVNSIWVMIIPGLISAWNMIIMRNFFYTIPDSLEESATLDGATPMQILLKIIFPLSLPAFATIGLFYAVGHWNAWFDAAIYINDRNKMPVQIIMRNIVLTMTTQDVNNEFISDFGVRPPAQTLKSAVIIISTIPILCIYPFLQKHFVKGIMIGSIKG
ncbi:MAG TPA: carbohydrate ABC transporter permease, partial [Clostridiaceae bacterium]|nr:carbohydrate ABC transporter permease [Clostridiaceae bacterium]